MPIQNYEKYWSLTLAYTDINSEKFIETLRAIVDFIDNNDTLVYSSELYKALQNKVSQANGLKDVSLRKSINQFVKLGFINFQLKSYHKDCKNFLEAKTERKRLTIFSKIVFENSSFNRDISKDSQNREINFLLKTLEHIGQLSTKDIMALMTQKIDNFPEGYLTKEELLKAKQNAEEIEFYERKYNQVNHFKAVLSRLDDLIFISGILYFKEDAQVVFEEELKIKTKKGRIGYLHRIYKNQLKNEAGEKLGDIKCMLEKLSYPSLVASHIKPFIDSEESEKYNPGNGLLLSRNMDTLFDQGYISFEDNGNIILSDKLKKDVVEHLKKYKLDMIFINEERKEYLIYHRDNIFKN